MWKTTIAGALAVAAAGFAQPVQAQYEGPWCAYVTIGSGSSVQRCDMRSFEMCLAEIHGQGGSCTQNPRYRGAEQPSGGVKKQRPRS